MLALTVPPRRSHTRQRLAVFLRVALAVDFAIRFVSSVAAAQPLPALPAVGTAEAPFLITFWCGPPPTEIDDRRMEEIAAAGFTVVGAPCEGFFAAEQNRRALDFAARHGLGMWIKDERLNGYHPLTPGWDLRLEQAVRAYGDHPALRGYYVVDEPDATHFADLATLVGRLRTIAPRHLAYINLYPNYVPPKYLAADSYEDYVERFLAVVRPELLSYDHYPFLTDGDRPDFFSNLWTIRRAAERHGVPFLLIFLAMPHLSYRDPTEAELAWQVFHALAFGARGISYFTYWTPLSVRDGNKAKFRYALIEEGKPTLHYFQAARINAMVAALGNELAGYQSWGVLDASGEVATGFPYGPIRAIEGGPVTAGVFVGPDAQLAFLLVNRDYRLGVDATLRVEPGSGSAKVFDPSTRRWDRMDGPIALEPGGARLVRFEH